jgi:antitoxin component HigA of HigAB toxin-antitoxin module
MRADNPDLKELVSLACARHRLTQAALAVVIGSCKQSLTNALHGRRELTTTQMAALEAVARDRVAS